MMSKSIFAAALLMPGAVLCTQPAFSATEQSLQHTHHRMAQSTHRRSGRVVAAAVQQPRQIACTVLGCQPIPAACNPKEEHTSSGIPTGYDTIVCPPGVWPF